MEKQKLTVIKVGGAVVEDEAQLAQLLKDFAAIGGRKMLVHGGGRRATAVASQLGIETQMVGGRRITDAEMLDVVTMVYGGLVNKTIVARLQALGINAIGLTGADLDCIRSHRRPPVSVRQEFHHPLPLLPGGGDSRVGAIPGGGDSRGGTIPGGEDTRVGAFPRGGDSRVGAFPRGGDSRVGTIPGGEDSRVGAFPGGGNSRVGVFPGGEDSRVGFPSSGEEGLGVVAKTIEIDYGFVGDVDRVAAYRLAQLVESGAVPVVAPLTHDGHGQLLNTNADTIASEVAVAMAAQGYDVTLVYCFEKAGVLTRPEDETSVIPTLTPRLYAQHKADGTISGGMLPKLDNAFAAIRAGVSQVVIARATDLAGVHGTKVVEKLKG